MQLYKPQIPFQKRVHEYHPMDVHERRLALALFQTPTTARPTEGTGRGDLRA